MRNFIITWGEEGEFLSLISTNATNNDVETMSDELKRELNSITETENQDEYVLEDIYDKKIKEVFHNNNFICAVLSISGIVVLE